MRSLRVYACRATAHTRTTSNRASGIIAEEKKSRATAMEGYESFAAASAADQWATVDFLLTPHGREGSGGVRSARQERDACCITAASGRTGIAYTVDRSPYKQGIPAGQHIPIIIRTDTRNQAGLCGHPAVNLQDEIMQQLQYIRDWGGRSSCRFRKWPFIEKKGHRPFHETLHALQPLR